MSSTDTFWLFGYGSNMQIKHIEEQKRIKVLDHTVSILKGYRLVFNLLADINTEPVFANTLKTNDEKDEIHGVAFCISKTDLDEMDRVELGYDREAVQLHAYDGRVIDGFVFVNKPSRALLDHDGTPSQRYLSLLIKGAKQAGLKEFYINDLKSRPTYEPSEETLKIREKFLALPLSDFQLIHQRDLPANSTSICGYIFQCHSTTNVHMLFHFGKEISLIRLYHFYGLDLSDPRTITPPYPSLEFLQKQHKNAHDYLLTWMDYYLHPTVSINCIGRLAEYVTTDDFSFPRGYHDPAEEFM